MRLAPTGDDVILPDARRQVNIPPPTRSIVPISLQRPPRALQHGHPFRRQGASGRVAATGLL